MIVSSPVSDHLFSPLVLNPHQCICWGSVPGCWDLQMDVVLCCMGHWPWADHQDRLHFPGLFSLPPSLFSLVSSATQRIWITAEIPSMHLQIMRVYCRSTLPLSFTSWFQPPTLPSVRIYLFESQANKAHIQSVGSASCSPGTPTLPIYSIWC